jgi:hypothetical protein
MTFDPRALTRAAESGDRAAILRATRDRLAAELADPECMSIAAVSRELRAVLAELEVLGATSEVNPLDRLADGVASDLDSYRARRRKDSAAS